MSKFFAALFIVLGSFLFPFSVKAKQPDVIAIDFFSLGKGNSNKPVIIKNGPGKPDQIIIDNPSKGPVVITPGQGGPVPIPIPGNGFITLAALVLVFCSIRRVPK